MLSQEKEAYLVGGVGMTPSAYLPPPNRWSLMSSYDYGSVSGGGVSATCRLGGYHRYDLAGLVPEPVP